MNVDLALHVHRHVLWDLGERFHVWVFRCDVCDDDMEFATWADAQAGAVRHMRRHREESCRHCGAAPHVRYSEWP